MDPSLVALANSGQQQLLTVHPYAPGADESLTFATPYMCLGVDHEKVRIFVPVRKKPFYASL